MVNPNQIEQTPHLSSISEAIEMRGLDQTDQEEQEEQPSESAIIRFRRALNPFNWDRRKVCSVLQGACFGVFLGSMYLCYVQPLVLCEEPTFNATRLNETIAERIGASNKLLGLLYQKNKSLDIEQMDLVGGGMCDYFSHTLSLNSEKMLSKVNEVVQSDHACSETESLISSLQYAKHKEQTVELLNGCNYLVNVLIRKGLSSSVLNTTLNFLPFLSGQAPEA